MNFFLLAGGRGERAKPLSLEKPKPLFPLGGIPLIKLMLLHLRDQGCGRGLINLHHLAEQIPPVVDGILPLTFLHEEELSGSRILRKSPPEFAEEGLLVVNGDVYLEIPTALLQRELQDHRCDAVLLVRPAATGYATLRCPDGWFTGVERSPSHNPVGSWMYTGVGLFSQPVLAAIEELNFFATLERHSFRVRCLPYTGVWLEIGTPRQYFDACWEFEWHQARSPGNILCEGVHIDPTAHVTGSIIWEQSRIGPETNLDRCIVSANMELTGIQASGRCLSPGGNISYE